MLIVLLDRPSSALQTELAKYEQFAVQVARPSEHWWTRRNTDALVIGAEPILSNRAIEVMSRVTLIRALRSHRVFVVVCVACEKPGYLQNLTRILGAEGALITAPVATLRIVAVLIDRFGIPPINRRTAAVLEGYRDSRLQRNP